MTNNRKNGWRHAALMATTALVSLAPIEAYAADNIVEGGSTFIANGIGYDFDDVTVGRNGDGTLTIENNGDVNDVNGYVGTNNSTGTVTVTGTGSSWTSTELLQIGSGGTGTLDILDAATVTAGSLNSYEIYLGINEAGPGFTNIGTGTVLVSGANSTLHSNDQIIIGYDGTGTLTVENGGVVSNDANSSIGGHAGDNTTSTSTGTVTVTGAGSSWTSAGAIDVGVRGTGTLDILDSGAVSAGDDIVLGRNSSGTGTVTVSGMHSGTSSSLTSGGSIFVGDAGDGTLNIENGGTVSSYDGQIGDDSGSTGTVTITGTGSSWTNTGGNLIVGFNGAGTLTVENGGSVSNGDQGFIGYGADSTSTATVTGAGSSWTSADDLIVGQNGTGTLNVLDGATVSSGNDLMLGTNAGADGTTLVSGSGSTLQADDSVVVGQGGTGTLTIAESGAVIVDSGGGTIQIGNNAGSTGTLNIGAAQGQAAAAAGTLNAATVAFGAGNSTLTFNHTDTDYSFAADITGSGFIKHFSGTTNLTGDASGVSGTTKVDGGTLNVSGSLNSSALHMNGGAFNVVDGGTFSDTGNAFIGWDPGSTGAASVTGAGSSWTMSGNLNVGDSGTGTLIVAGGGTFSNTGLAYIGASTTATGTVTVTGENSSLDITNELHVGHEGAGTLNVLDGAEVTNNGMGFVGYLGSSTGTATVTGAGSSWTTDGVYVGDSGAGTLNVLDGATVSSGDDVFLGNTSSGSGTALVSGTGSTVQVNDVFAVGFDGDGTLTIEDGGAVSNGGLGYVGFGADSTSTATVTGAGSSWTNANYFVGVNGTGTLNVLDGATVSSADDVFLGYLTDSKGTVLVSGSGSTLQANDALTIGFIGAGTLTLADGGVARVGTGGGTLTLASQAGSTGTLNIGAAAGDAAAAGTLDAAAVQFGAGDGTLNFNHTDTGHDFGAAITGAGTLNHLAGVTNLSADSSGFTGTTSITGGTLRVNNALGGTVNVAGGTLGGSGSLGNLAVAAGGTLAPGNSIGTLNVANVIINAGSTYEVEVNSAGQSDLINATGTATINGGAVTVLPFPDFALDTAYTIVKAAGGVTGAFDSASYGAGSLFITPTLTYDANNAFVTLAQTAAFASAAMTPNQIAAAGGADSLGSGNAIWNAIANLNDAGQARAAFDALSGEIHASAKTALIEDSRFVRDAATDRVRAAFAGVAASAVPVLAYGEDGRELVSADTQRFAVWGQGFGSWSRWNGDGNTAAMSRDIGGLFIGGDAEIADNARLGLMGGYAHSSLGVAGRMSSATADSYTLGVYGGGQWDAFSLRGGVAYTWHNIATTRSVAFTGFADSLSASYTARTLQAYAEAAYAIDIGGARVEPFANLAYVNLATNGFTEAGGAAALTANGQGSNAAFTTLGIRVEAPVVLGETTATLSGGLGWRHAFGATPTATHGFAAGGSAFTVAGVPLARDVLVLNAGFDVDLTDSASLGLSYNGRLGSGVSDHGARASFNVTF